MFQGNYQHTIDEKGRIIVPARFREAIRAASGGAEAEGVMLSRKEGCLYAYAYPQWREIATELQSLAKTSAAMQRFRRVFIGNAADCPFDKQGRILIPTTLRDHARLDKDVVLVGVQEHFEFWNPESWAMENERVDEEMQKGDVQDEIASLGILL